MPTPKPGEKEEDYIPRCVREVMGEGVGQQAALGKCYGLFREHQHKVAECHAQAIHDETLAQADKLGIQNPEHWAANAQKMVMVEHTQAVRKELIEATKKLVVAVKKTTDYRSDEGKMVDEAYKIEKSFKEDDHPREDDGRFKGDGDGAGEGGRQSGGGVHSEDYRGAERRPLGYGGSESDRAYTREDIAGGKASRASVEAARSFEREHRLATGAVVAVHHQANGTRHYELSGEKGAEFYHKTLDDLRSRNSAGAQVSLKPVSDYKSMRLFVDDGANAACALDGQDIVSACSNPGKGKPSAFPGMLQSMIDEGGKTGDCYGTFLPAYYARFGLEMQARLPWNQEVWDDYAAEERKTGRLSEDQLDNKKVFADFGGKPDYYLFAYTGNTKLRPVEDVPIFDNWNKAAEERDKALTKKKIEKAAVGLAILAVNKALGVFGVAKGAAYPLGRISEHKDGTTWIKRPGGMERIVDIPARKKTIEDAKKIKEKLNKAKIATYYRPEVIKKMEWSDDFPERMKKMIDFHKTKTKEMEGLSSGFKREEGARLIRKALGANKIGVKKALEAWDKQVDFIKTSKPCIAIDANTLASILLKDDRFRNQFQTNESNGILDIEMRESVEADFSGGDHSWEDSERPIYGYLRGDDYTDYGVGNYGSCDVVLKDHIKDRMTMSIDDSLGSEIGVFLPSENGLFEAFANAKTKYGKKVMAKQIKDYASRGDFLDYQEIQVWGGAHICDIEKVVVDNKKTLKKIQYELKKAGKKTGITFQTKDGYSVVL